MSKIIEMPKHGTIAEYLQAARNIINAVESMDQMEYTRAQIENLYLVIRTGEIGYMEIHSLINMLDTNLVSEILDDENNGLDDRMKGVLEQYMSQPN